MFTADMFQPIVDGITTDTPIIVKVAISIMATPFIARKLFGVFYSLAS